MRDELDAAAPATLNVQVIHAWPEKVWRQTVQLAPNATVQDAINRSGILQALPELADATLCVGLYGRLADLQEPLHDNDRVELYRPLQYDPKESRRRRAAHRLAQQQAEHH